MSAMDAEALWAQLRQAGLVEGEPTDGQDDESPWYVRVMLGVAGWIGAMFLLGFVGTGLSLVLKSASAAFAVGAVLCAAAIVLYRLKPKGDFINQFAFAVSLAGQGLIGFGLGQLMSPRTEIFALPIVVLEAALFALIPNFLHRVWSTMAGAYALVLVLSMSGLGFVAHGLILAVLAWTWLNEFRSPIRSPAIRAFGYGLSLYVVFELIAQGWKMWAFAMISTRGQMPFSADVRTWIAAALIGAVAVWVVWRLMARQGVAASSPGGRAVLAGALLIAAVSLKAPGIGTGVVILLLGYANGNRILAGLGILGLLVYWSHYYYLLQITLLEKSMVLACAGIALLAVRLAMRSAWPAKDTKEAGHA
jgi:hypothetical protein